MRKFITAVSALSLAWATPAIADTVCDWFEFANRVANASSPPPGSPRTPDHDRAITQVALAMFEALNAIDRRHTSCLDLAVVDAGASQDAASATAAYRVLLHHFPGQRTMLDENYAMAMEGVADVQAREAGGLVGERAAEAALAAGGIDPAIAQVHYRPRARPGEWIGAQLPVIEPLTAAFRPWAIPNVEALRPPPPPALTSARWARDYEEVRRLGGRDSSTRTPHQTLMARYRITPDMTPVLRLTTDQPGRRPVQNARMFALVQMAADDSYMATMAAKVHYNFWRPLTSIRNGDQDGNDATPHQADWLPLIATPNHPEYPCGHCTFAGSVAEVMTAEVGARPASGVRVSSYSIPNATVQVWPAGTIGCGRCRTRASTAASIIASPTKRASRSAAAGRAW